jgi:hypothetical protein
MAGKWDFILHQGEDFERIITFQDQERAAIIQTGMTYEGQIRPYAGASGAAVEDFTCEVLNQTTYPGKIKISIAKEDTVDIPVDESSEEIGIRPKKYVYDIWRTDSNGKKVKALYGVVTVIPQVST